MITVSAPNVNIAYSDMAWKFQALDRAEELIVLQSRNGPVKRLPSPVCTTYYYPCERVLFNVSRDANPFFHLLESLWMLAGRNDVGFVASLVKRMADYSDNGRTVHGAYGHRWRQHFNHDQVNRVISHLRDKPNSRRAVIAMWDPDADLPRLDDGKDVPCNTHIYFSIVKDKLDMTTCCRSNDVIWGALGANAVHMTMLQEYIARCLELRVGKYYQFSNDYHIYTDQYSVEQWAQSSSAEDDLYGSGKVRPFPLISIEKERWDSEIWEFFLNHDQDFTDPFIEDTAKPLYTSYLCYKEDHLGKALQHARTIRAEDWRHACVAWLERRVQKRQQPASGG